MTVALVGATYGAVPVYRMFCAATGYGGTVQEGASVEAKLRAREENPNAEVETAAAARQLTVSFNADVSDGMPWKFVPTQRSIKVRSCGMLPEPGKGEWSNLSAARERWEAL